MPAGPSKIPYLPERIAGLERLALNLWWRWDRRARLLFRTVDPVLWSATRHNPVAMLRRVDPNRLAQLSHDEEFLAQYESVLAGLDSALDPARGWFREAFPNVGDQCFAYFCAEFGLHNSIPIYSGGLGVLAGDHCKAASDLGVPLVGVGLLYSKGYFDQKLNIEGWQEDSDEVFDPRIMPLVQLTGEDDSHALAVLETAGRPVHIGAWRLTVGRVELYLLDTNLPENDPADRELTHKLYAGGQEHRLKQEWILGRGRRSRASRARDLARRLARQRRPRGVHDDGAPERASPRRHELERGGERGQGSFRLHHAHAGPGRARHLLPRPDRDGVLRATSNPPGSTGTRSWLSAVIRRSTTARST